MKRRQKNPSVGTVLEVAAVTGVVALGVLAFSIVRVMKIG